MFRSSGTFLAILPDKLVRCIYSKSSSSRYYIVYVGKNCTGPYNTFLWARVTRWISVVRDVFIYLSRVFRLVSSLRSFCIKYNDLSKDVAIVWRLYLLFFNFDTSFIFSGVYVFLSTYLSIQFSKLLRNSSQSSTLSSSVTD